MGKKSSPPIKVFYFSKRTRKNSPSDSPAIVRALFPGQAGSTPFSRQKRAVSAFWFFDGLNPVSRSRAYLRQNRAKYEGLRFRNQSAKPKAALRRQNLRNTEGWFFGGRGGKQKTNRRLARCRRLALLRRFSPSGGGAGCPAVLLTVSLPRGDNRLHSL